MQKTLLDATQRLHFDYIVTCALVETQSTPCCQCVALIGSKTSPGESHYFNRRTASTKRLLIFRVSFLLLWRLNACWKTANCIEELPLYFKQYKLSSMKQLRLLLAQADQIRPDSPHLTLRSSSRSQEGFVTLQHLWHNFRWVMAFLNIFFKWVFSVEKSHYRDKQNNMKWRISLVQ